MAMTAAAAMTMTMIMTMATEQPVLLGGGQGPVLKCDGSKKERQDEVDVEGKKGT
jgi:hypothetical protein